MNIPAQNRLHDYETGSLTLLLKMGVTEECEFREAQNRATQAAIEELHARRDERRAEWKQRRRKRNEE